MCQVHHRGHPAANLGSRAGAGGHFFLKHIPVPRGLWRHLQGFLPEQSFPAFSGGSRPGQGSTAPSSSSVSLCTADMCSTLRMRRLKRFFALFPRSKKCEGHRAVECESARALGSSLSAHHVSSATSDERTTRVDDNDDAWVLLDNAHYVVRHRGACLGAGV